MEKHYITAADLEEVLQTKFDDNFAKSIDDARLSYSLATPEEKAQCIKTIQEVIADPAVPISGDHRQPQWEDAWHEILNNFLREKTLRSLAPRYFGIVQICDARGTHASSDYIKDVHNRDVPGQGDLPLHDLLSAVPAAHRRAAGVTAAEHVRDVLAGARAIVDGLTPNR